MDGNEELVRIYRQMDGYCEGHGVDLARLCTDKITNGLYGGGTVNGLGELAARVATGLKSASLEGNIYLETTDGEIGEWIEYVYVVCGKEGEKPMIECRTNASGEWPFNTQTKTGDVFKATRWSGSPSTKRKAQRDASPCGLRPACMSANAR
jgi:hypothetical protein